MERAIQLLGHLFLTFVGFVVPIVGVLLSLFREGISKLNEEYKNQRQQSEQNIKEQLKKLAEAETADTVKIKENLKELESIKRVAEAKISLLNPRNQMLWLTVPLLLSYIALMLFPNTDEIYYMTLLIVLGGITIGYAIFAFWRSVTIISEVAAAVNDKKSDQEKRTIEVLSAILDKSGRVSDYFLNNVYITVDNKDVKDDGMKLEVEANKKKEFKIGIRNLEKQMAKNIEIGFIFPSDFIIEKSPTYSEYTTEREKIVRYEAEAIQGLTHLVLNPLIVTPLKKGAALLRTFVKGENIEATYRNVTLKVGEV